MNNNLLPINNIKNKVIAYCKQLPYAKYILEEEFINSLSAIYFIYPYLYSPAFVQNKNKTTNTFLENLSIVGFLIYRSTIIKDRLIDNDDTEKIKKLGYENYLGAKEVCTETAIKLLYKLFNEKSLFWKFWKKRKSEYLEAVKLDKELKNGYVNKNTYRKYADYKSALGKLAIDALFVYFNETSNNVAHKNLLNAHKSFSTYMQLTDDFSDIASDYVTHQFNWCLNIIKNDNHNDNNYKSISTIKHIFYFNNYAENTVLFAKKEINKTINVIKPYNCSIWLNVLEKQLQQLDINLFIINNYINVQKKKSELLKIKNNNLYNIKFSKKSNINIPKFVKKSILNIIKESENDFLELKHIMWLPPNEGFSGSNTTYVGDVFSRAILGCFLSNLNNNNAFYGKTINKLIKKQIDVLIQRRRKTKTGGWSYLPEAIEIAADSDDLGQIIQFLYSANRKDLIDKYCKVPIKILLEHCTNNDGGIKTWIIPNKKTKEEKIQSTFNKTKWGEGPDIEVMANFLFGLSQSYPNKYKKEILSGCYYILKNINPNGYWVSRWYYGNYYGTYICISLLKTMNLLPEKILKTTNNYLLSTQNTDGGWGLLKNKSDSLNTAFALLSLTPNNFNKINIKKGLIFLKKQQKTNGLWEKVNFIRPRAVEPYSSEIITSIFVLKSILYHQDILLYE